MFLGTGSAPVAAGWCVTRSGAAIQWAEGGRASASTAPAFPSCLFLGLEAHLCFAYLYFCFLKSKKKQHHSRSAACGAFSIVGWKT